MLKNVIEKIRLENFKCYNNLEEELSPITILAGENAAGKSSFIQAILIYDSAIQNKDDNLFTFDVHGLNLGAASGIVCENAKEDDSSIEVSLTINSDKSYVKLTPVDYEDTFLRVEIGDNFRSLNHLFYLNAERIGPRVYNDITSEGLFSVGTHGQNSIYVMNQLDKLLATQQYKGSLCLDKLKKMSDGETMRFSAICEKYLSDIIPGTSLKANSFTDQGTSTIRYTNFSGTDIIPTATGFGITYVLPIVVQSLVSLLFSDSVLIVENPEAHLHPYSQSMIGRFLAKIAVEGVQVIVETHSEHFTNGCRLELSNCKKCDIAKIIFFCREKESHELRRESISIDGTGELSNWPEGFFDQNERDLMELLRKKVCH